MTIKTKRGLAVGGGTALCAALAILIAARFAPEPEAVTPNTPEVSTTPSVSVKISTPKTGESATTDKGNSAEKTSSEPDNTQISNPVEADPEKEIKDFIDSGGIEIKQDFSEPEKSSEPPAPPEIEDEEMLTNPNSEPTYDTSQTTVTAPETSANPNINPSMHGQKKDGMIFINGFGWVVDNGGGGEGEYLDEMYENGNKIGSFG